MSCVSHGSAVLDVALTTVGWGCLDLFQPGGDRADLREGCLAAILGRSDDPTLGVIMDSYGDGLPNTAVFLRDGPPGHQEGACRGDNSGVTQSAHGLWGSRHLGYWLVSIERAYQAAFRQAVFPG